MNDLPATPLNNSAQASRETKIKDSIVQNKTGFSPDFLVHGGKGTSLKLKRKHKFGYSGMEYANDFDPSAYYRKDQIVRVQPNVTYSDYHGTTITASVGTWRCVYDVPDQRLSDSLTTAGHTSGIYSPYLRQPGITYCPISPEAATTASYSNPSGAYWQQIGATSAQATVFQLATGYPNAQTGDYVIAYPWNNGSFNTSAPTKIAKPFRLRNSVSSEIMGGVTYNYSYGADFVSRTVTWTYSGTNYTEAQVIVPAWTSYQTLLAMNVGYTGVSVSGSDVGWIDLNINAMAWMRQFS